jgi:hypothetical protein
MVMESKSKNFKKKTREKKMKNCKKCEQEFQPKDDLDIFCSQDCKEEALAELDSDSDECLSCQ